MQKCTAKVKTQMTKTNAIKGGKNYSKNKTASKKNNSNDLCTPGAYTIQFCTLLVLSISDFNQISIGGTPLFVNTKEDIKMN